MSLECVLQRSVDLQIRLSNGDQAIFDFNTAIGEQVDHFGVDFAFGGKDSLLQCLGVVVGVDFNNLLSDHWSVVVFVVDKMGRAARNFAAVVDHCLMYSHAVESLATKCRNQTRMNVDNAISKIFRNDDPFQKPAHDNEVALCISTVVENSRAEQLIGLKALASVDLQRDAGIGCELVAASF